MIYLSFFQPDRIGFLLYKGLCVLRSFAGFAKSPGGEIPEVDLQLLFKASEQYLRV